MTKSPYSHEGRSRKPDPDNPWRYECPKCNAQVHKRASIVDETYRCKSCNGYFEFSELWDKKEKTVVRDRDNWTDKDID